MPEFGNDTYEKYKERSEDFNAEWESYKVDRLKEILVSINNIERELESLSKTLFKIKSIVENSSMELKHIVQIVDKDDNVK